MARVSSVFIHPETGEKWKTCPNTVTLKGQPNRVCNHQGPIETDFGWRIMRGKPAPQSWCINCRKAGERLDGTKKTDDVDRRKRPLTQDDRDRLDKAFNAPPAEPISEPKKHAPPVTITGAIVTANDAKTRALFDSAFPDDQFGGQRRAWVFMANALKEAGATLSDDATERLNRPAPAVNLDDL